MTGFARSREDREIKKERTTRRRAAAGGDEAPLITVSEHTVRQQNGDPRFLNIAWRVADREDRLWLREEEGVGRSSPVANSLEERDDRCLRLRRRGLFAQHRFAIGGNAARG